MKITNKNRNKTALLYLITLPIYIASCQANPIHTKNQIPCPDSRPQMCTMDYKTVCGIFVDKKTKTFPNGCTACSDDKVVAYTRSKCPE